MSKPDLMTSVKFQWRDEHVSLEFEDGSTDDLMCFNILYWDDSREEANEPRCCFTQEFTLDEMEYIAHRMLDAIEFQRKRNGLVPYNCEPLEYRPRIENEAYTEEKEKEVFKKAILKAGGDKKKAAEIIGCSTRTLYGMLIHYGLEDYIIDKV